MKRMTRMISLVLCLALCAALFAVSGHAAGGLANFTARKTYSADLFTDVKPADWFAANVETVYELGLMNGKGGSKF
ncbi:MAG: S-layer homology domain-containing protein, partial [Clostridia bacterium]|nr:S-layer homology domain-containing protein [Clostridia bacterium]